jgi:SAM-dependent methyltransferase
MEYAETVRQLYLELSGHHEYLPERDELTVGMAATLPINELFTKTSPWSFESAPFMAEFLASWAAMMRHMPASSDADILEYGPGSGQFLLSLARLGYRTYGVDIEPKYLELIQQQAQAMSVPVQTEQGHFGEGFTDKKFDRIVFFEALHHAPDFLSLLCRLHGKIVGDGMLILCGEPVVDDVTTGPVPFPWGPRLDGLSIHCMREWGWMELGFQRSFLIEALMRCGWTVRYFPSTECFRANLYLARPWNGEVQIGDPLELGRCSTGWSDPEAHHRWTTGPAELPMPCLLHRRFDVSITVGNYIPAPLTGRVACGAVEQPILLGEGEESTIHLAACTAARLKIDVPGRELSRIIPGASDTRTLGIAVRSIRVTPTPS